MWLTVLPYNRPIIYRLRRPELSGTTTRPLTHTPGATYCVISWISKNRQTRNLALVLHIVYYVSLVLPCIHPNEESMTEINAGGLVLYSAFLECHKIMLVHSHKSAYFALFESLMTVYYLLHPMIYTLLRLSLQMPFSGHSPYVTLSSVHPCIRPFGPGRPQSKGRSPVMIQCVVAASIILDY